MFVAVLEQSSIFMRQNYCSQSRPTNSTRDCFVMHQARPRVCYVMENHHRPTPRLVFIHFILFYVWCAHSIVCVFQRFIDFVTCKEINYANSKSVFSLVTQLST